ncbi:hypothetical protein EJB05_26271, partial [Eragrostis curvula]
MNLRSSASAPYCPEYLNSIINTEAANALHILPSSGQCPSSMMSAASSSPAVGHEMTEFVPERTAAYISRHDLTRRLQWEGKRPMLSLTTFSRHMQVYCEKQVLILFDIQRCYTQEEKSEPLENMNDDPVIRFLNWLYAKKRKELQEHQRLKDVQLPEEQKDVRHLDEILCFINRNGGMSMASYTRILKSLADWKQRRRDWSKQGSIVETREDDGSRSLTTDETKCQKMMLKISLRELAHKSTMEDAVSEV